MARQTIAPFIPPVGDALAAITPGSATITQTAMVPGSGNKEQCVATGREMLLFHNTHATNAYTVTITSSADAYGRTQDIETYSIPAGDIAIFGPLEYKGWVQSDGKIYFEASDASMKCAVIRVP